MRTFEWADVAERRRTMSAAGLAVATSRRTRRHRPRTKEERAAIVLGVLATYRQRVASGDIEWLGRRELRVRVSHRDRTAMFPGPSSPSP